MDGKTVVPLELEPGECVVILEQEGTGCEAVHKSFRQQTEGLKCMDISAGWLVSTVKSKEYPNFPVGAVAETLAPISDEKPSFAGVIRYEKTVWLDKAPAEAVLYAENAYEMMKVTVNGQQAGVRLLPPYQVKIGKYVKTGENSIVIEVATTPAREMLEIPQPPFDFSHEALEPTGMFGNVKLYIR